MDERNGDGELDPDGDVELDPDGVDPADIEPAGAMIAVAFTGAMIGLVGAGFVPFVGDAALVFVVLGVTVVLASPVAYLRFRRLD